eukprot:gene21131-biopygen10155
MMKTKNACGGGSRRRRRRPLPSRAGAPPPQKKRGNQPVRTGTYGLVPPCRRRRRDISTIIIHYVYFGGSVALCSCGSPLLPAAAPCSCFLQLRAPNSMFPLNPPHPTSPSGLRKGAARRARARAKQHMSSPRVSVLLQLEPGTVHKRVRACFYAPGVALALLGQVLQPCVQPCLLLLAARRLQLLLDAVDVQVQPRAHVAHVLRGLALADRRVHETEPHQEQVQPDVHEAGSDMCRHAQCASEHWLVGPAHEMRVSPVESPGASGGGSSMPSPGTR